MTLPEITNELTGIASIARFNSGGTSSRTAANYRHLARWADMSMEEFAAEIANAKAENKTIEVFSEAFNAGGEIRMPVDDAGHYLQPVLADIISMQKERISRVNYAKDMELKEFDTAALARSKEL